MIKENFKKALRMVGSKTDLTLKVHPQDVESLREHYALTLRHWVANLEDSWTEAVALVGSRRARVWRLYMAGSAINFTANELSIHQVLAVNTPDSGASGMPATRDGFSRR